MRRSSQGARASSARTSSTRSSPAATRWSSSTTSPTGSRERQPGAELVVADIRDRQAVEEAFQEARPRRACTSRRRPTCGCRSRGPTSTGGERPRDDPAARGRARARDAHRLRLHRRRHLRECAEPATRAAARAPFPYGTSKLAGRSTWPPTTGSTGASTRRCATATSSGPPGPARRGRRRRHLPRPGAARRRTSSATAPSSATTSTSATSPRPVAALERPAGVFNIGPGSPRPCSSCSRRAGARPASTSSRFDPPRLGELQRSVLDAGLAERELGFARDLLRRGDRGAWEFIRSAEGEEAAGRTRPARGESRRPSRHPALALRRLHRGDGGHRRAGDPAHRRHLALRQVLLRRGDQGDRPDDGRARCRRAPARGFGNRRSRRGGIRRQAAASPRRRPCSC